MDDQAREPFVVPDPAVLPTNTPGVPKRLDDLEDLVKAVFIVIVISVGALVVSVAGIVIDQLHFNNELYRDNYYNHTKTVVQTVVDKPTQVIFPNIKPTN